MNDVSDVCLTTGERTCEKDSRVPGRNWTYDLRDAGRMLWWLRHENSCGVRSLDWVVAWLSYSSHRVVKLTRVVNLIHQSSMIFYNEVHLLNRLQFLLVFIHNLSIRTDRRTVFSGRISQWVLRTCRCQPREEWEISGHADVISGRDEKYLNGENISHQFKMIPPYYEMEGRTPTEENPEKKNLY